MAGVVYIMFCKCGMFYFGKTKCQFWQRIKHHVNYGRYNKLSTLTGRQKNLRHRNDQTVAKFTALEEIVPSPKGGDWYKVILQREC